MVHPAGSHHAEHSNVHLHHSIGTIQRLSIDDSCVEEATMIDLE